MALFVCHQETEHITQSQTDHFTNGNGYMNGVEVSAPGNFQKMQKFLLVLDEFVDYSLNIQAFFQEHNAAKPSFYF